MPRRPRRTREEITYSILMVLKVTPRSQISRIMQKVRLNYYQAKNYLARLASKEYIAEKNGVYVLLDRGRRFITQYEALKTINRNMFK